MPVVVTGASGVVGPYAVRAFSRVSPEVRAYIRRPAAADALRRAGAKVAVGWIDDVDTLTAVMAGAHTVCHLVGAPWTADPGVQGEVAAAIDPVLAAAAAAGVARFLALSIGGASPAASDVRLRASAAVESAIRGSRLEFAIVRTTWIYGQGSPLLEALRPTGRMGGIGPRLRSGRRTVAPVFAGDVADVLAAADDREMLRSGIWGLRGPERVTVGAIGLADAEDDQLPDASAEFGVALTPLAEGLARSRRPDGAE